MGASMNKSSRILEGHPSNPPSTASSAARKAICAEKTKKLCVTECRCGGIFKLIQSVPVKKHMPLNVEIVVPLRNTWSHKVEIVVQGYAVRASSVARRRDTTVLRNVCYDMKRNMFQFLSAGRILYSPDREQEGRELKRHSPLVSSSAPPSR
jgi:hypothetical protein